MEEVTERATEKLRSENAALVDALASRTAETLSAVEGARSTLADSVADLIGRMSTSSGQLGQLIEQAAANLGQVDERLTGSTQSFAATTEKAAQTFASSARLVDSNTTRLTELSSSTLREVASIATKFDEHSRLLSSASDLLSSAQSNLEHTLERQSSLEDLAVGLVKKSEDLEKVMRSFEDLVGQTLQNAEGKTLESADKIRTSIADVVDSATKRFADATEEMRRTASSIKSELDLTRAELKKGVIEMPEEAKESTTAIRRAVSEQINALKELSEIVAKSGRSTDSSEPRNLRPAQQTPAPRATEPLRRPPAPELLAPQAPSGDTTLRSDLERPPETAPRQRDPNGRAPQGGWVRDLLTGASREEAAKPAAPSEAPRSTAPAQRSPLHVVESLNSLSVDIARAIDHDASIELWNRYRSGERDVFTRRLYTLKGQQTFDEIRRKYQMEAEFRAAVDRYCDDFEKLLKDVSRNDRDNMMAQTYLTSDTGKVYTMLAHASGRLH
ncbi:MAG: kinesin, partial [Mesorhizobium sp.]